MAVRGLRGGCVSAGDGIGVARPVSLFVDTFGTGRIPDQKICAALHDMFDLTPRGIIKMLSLLRPIYQATASLGHFGRQPTDDGQFTWERTDRADELRKSLLR